MSALYALVIRPEAKADVEETYQWYETKRTGLGEAFLQAFRDSAEKIQTNPLMYQKVYKNIRRTLFEKFPYSLFFIVDDESVIVIGCFHVKRNPNTWKKRK